jgi:predicted XRE-type DNA-binding protein
MTQITEGSGNVFQDLDLENPEEELVKAELTHQIYKIIIERGLTQTAAAKLLGLKQPDVSALMRGRFSGFSIERLFSLLRSLNRNIEIVIKPGSEDQSNGTIRVLTVANIS